MGILPQELLDMVIDQLADCEPPPGPPVGISHYSTVSRQWVARSQKHHFERVRFSGPGDLGKWCRTIEPDPSGVSRHVREAHFSTINCADLERFSEHIRAFTNIEEVILTGECGILLSPSVVESLAPLGSNLVRLKIIETSTTPRIITSLLATLPCLRQLRAHRLDVRDGCNTAELPPGVPFFRDANSLDLCLGNDTPGSFDWIPPSARFRELWIDRYCIGSGRAKQWIASSSGCLKFLGIKGHPRGHHSASLDLTGCTALDTLQIDLPLWQDCEHPRNALPCLSLFRLPKIIFRLLVFGSNHICFQYFEVAQKHLRRLAKQLKATHPGRKMEVELSVCDPYGRSKAALADWIDSGRFKLRKEENVVVVVVVRRET